MTPIVMAGIVAATLLACAFAYLGFRNDYNESLRRRQLNKYRDRLRKLDNIILGLPSSYLPKTLKALVYTSIADSLEQISRLTGDKNYSDQIERVKQQLKLLQANTSAGNLESQDFDTSSLREYRHLLKDLHALILDFHTEGLLSQQQAELQVQVVNDILLGASLEFYCEAAQQSMKGGNKALALHYFSMAKGQLESSSSESLSQAKLPQIIEKMNQLTIELENEARLQETVGMPDAAVLKEWDALNKDEDKWRKKNYY